MTPNKAAWIKAIHQPLTVDSAPYPTPGPGELVVKNAFVAVNPVDWKIQESGGFLTEYPWILGTDVAGEVVEVGARVTRFKKGDRVISYALSLIKPPSYGGFQLYTLALELVTAPIPKDIKYENAVVLPLALSTAAAGLYQSDLLHLPYPSLSTGTDAGKGKGKSNGTLIVCGASSSVGSAVVQLATASGLDVVATASPRHFAYAKDLGAKAVLDYHSADLTEKVVEAVKATGTRFVGLYDAVGRGGWEGIMGRLKGKAATVLNPPRKLPVGVTASGPTKYQDVANAVWRDFVPQALQSGQLKPKLDPIIIEGGLEKVQAGLDRQKQGVSAAKVVIPVA
ncbi:hypothetical protein MPDQ_007181 [Monascus purpureus]|uniref:Enoyl reductase (ER) domain-containing protein n=1 Tax=Monascus purpureus TaxID=5098 RepID=A0A507QST3_MONPU|nr:hypothetical protein MPDQ_007181 [Monascus purpureus]